MLKIGIFGGTFDPPHLGHLILATEAMEQLGLDKVYWVITPESPHKIGQNKADVSHRIHMVELAIRNEPKFAVSMIELDRPGPHFTADTMAIIRAEHPSDHLTLLLGGDSLAQLPTWKDPIRILNLVDRLGVMRRPGEVLPNLTNLPEIEEKMVTISAPLLQISSREIRAKIAEGKNFRYYLPEGVFEYIFSINLYR